VDLTSPNRNTSGTVLLQKGILNEVKVEKCDGAGFSPAQS